MFKQTDIIHVKNIDWDDDWNNENPEGPKVLPKELDIVCEALMDEYGISPEALNEFEEEDFDDYIGDYLSDNFGICVNGFNYTVKEQ